MEQKQANIAFWNELTAIHERSKFYDVPSFLSGKQTLQHVELKELGNVSGKSLLHLQCHFGMDTLSWARLGAQVTGVDFSDRAIDLAQKLNVKLDLDARFIQSDVFDLPSRLKEQFDIVFTSYGVLCWLQNLDLWAQTIAHFLKPQGTFLLVEEHPLAYIIDEHCNVDNIRLGYSYFDKSTLTMTSDGSYADPIAKIKPSILENLPSNPKISGNKRRIR